MIVKKQKLAYSQTMDGTGWNLSGVDEGDGGMVGW